MSNDPEHAVCDTHGAHDPASPCPECTPGEAVMHQLKALWQEGPWAETHGWPVDGETFNKMVAVIEGELRPMHFIEIDPAKIDTEAIEKFAKASEAHRVMIMPIDDAPSAYGPPFQRATKKLNDKLAKQADLLETAWGLIANAGGWDDKSSVASPGWKAAAERWRDEYHGGPPGVGHTQTKPDDSAEEGT